LSKTGLLNGKKGTRPRLGRGSVWNPDAGRRPYFYLLLYDVQRRAPMGHVDYRDCWLAPASVRFAALRWLILKALRLVWNLLDKHFRLAVTFAPEALEGCLIFEVLFS